MMGTEDVALRPGILRAPGTEEAGKVFPWSPQRELCPDHAWFQISGPSNCESDTLVLF